MIGIMPYIAYEWENLHIGIDDISYEFFNDRTLALTASLEPRSSFADTDDSAIFEGIERDGAFEAGLMANYKIWQNLVSTWYLDGLLLQDISHVHKGQEIEIALGFNREFARFEYDIAAGAIYHSKTLNQHLYGVTTSEAGATGLKAFYPAASAYPFIDVSMQMQMWGPSLLVISASSELYDSEIQNSPLLGKVIQTDLLIGLVGQF
jgi:outer membrane scaffolding protein for murein synthesis (MipA/OmpV family)